MKQAVWVERYPVSSFLVDFEKKLALHHLLGLLQETAWRHSANLEIGYQQSHERGVSWVLIRQRIEMESWPDWGDELHVRSWLRPPGAVVVTRDFELSVGGREVGQAAAHWITIDEGHRRPVPLLFPRGEKLFREDGHLHCEPSKLPLEKGLQKIASFEVRHSDLDMHGHVNNTRFAQWILDSLPLRSLQEHTLTGYEVNFLAEALPNENVDILWRPATTQGAAIPFQGVRASDGKVLFTAALNAQAKPLWGRGSPEGQE